MIYVTMKDGRTIRYNNGSAYFWNELGAVRITDRADNHIARISIDGVERVEFVKPCAITDKHGKAIKVRY